MIEGKQWEIIRILAQGNKTPTEIAKILKISLPGLHRHLAGLEREGRIKRADATKGKTRPYTTYTIGNGFIYFAKGNAREGSDIDILLLVKKDVKKFEKMFGSVAVGKKGKKAMVMAQVFETSDFKNSLKKGSRLAEEIMKCHKAVYDPAGILLTQSSA
ncbi:MAG: ArsR family transcriptional regulator [Nanoarchaeota archaeon]|nr:ArsR family transcriptional regulator [Nanoarchaeota archaeon]